MALRARSRFSVALLSGALALAACGGDDAVSTAQPTADAGPTFAPPTTEEPSRVRQGSTPTTELGIAFDEATTTTAAPQTTTTTTTTAKQPEFGIDFTPPRPSTTAVPAAPPIDQKADSSQTTTTIASTTTAAPNTTVAPNTTTTEPPAPTTTEPATPAWCTSAQKLTTANPLDPTSAGEVTSMRLSGPNEGDWTTLNAFIGALQDDNAAVPDAATITSGENLDALAVAQCGGPFMDAWFTAFGGWPANS